VRYLRMAKDRVVVSIESGSYNFLVQPPPGS